MLELALILVIAIGLVSGHFISLYSLAIYIDPDELETLYPKISRSQRNLLKKLADDPRVFTQTAIVYKSFVLVALSFAMVSFLKLLGLRIGVDNAVLIPIGLILVWLLYLFFVEYLPRRSSRRAINLEMTKHLWMITLVYVIFLPIVKLYRLALKRGGESFPVTEEEKEEIVERAIETLAEEAGIGEAIVEEDEKEMIGQIFQLDQTVAREIMVPRIDITAIEKSMSFKDIRAVILKDGHSRYPVHDGTIDKIIGLIYVKDLFNRMPEPGEEFVLTKYLRKPYFVPESKVIGELLTEFKAKHLHIAIVVDEYGGVAGLVTLEDIIEEIFGEIQDEHDLEEAEFSELPDGRYRVSASMMMEKLQDLFDTDFEQEDYNTVGGLIYDLVGSVPAEGLKIKWHEFEFEVEKVEGQRILYVKVRPLR
jgi:magnesium and cobalt transporter